MNNAADLNQLADVMRDGGIDIHDLLAWIVQEHRQERSDPPLSGLEFGQFFELLRPECCGYLPVIAGVFELFLGRVGSRRDI